MKELVDYIVKSLVSNPDDVKIEEENDGDAVTLKLSVNPEDMGIVIGKSGQTIRAIRRLLIARVMGENPNLRVNLTIEEVK